MNLYFICKSRSNIDVFCVSVALKTSSSRRREGSVQFQKEKYKFRCCGSRSQEHSEFGHLTLLFAEDGKEILKEYITLVQSYFSAH